MDHKELEYIPRKVGETWSCYWNTYKPHRSPETPPQTNWDFFTPPYTPRTEVSPTASSETSTHSNDQNRLISTYSKESNSKQLSNDPNDDDVITIADDDEPEELKSSAKNNSDFLHDITNPSASTTFPLDKLKNFKNTTTNSPKTRIPTIVNIESMNLVNVGDIKKLPGEKLILKGLDKCKKEKNDILSFQETLDDSIVELKVPENSQSNVKKEDISIKSEALVPSEGKIEVKTVKLEGLPTVTLSYQVPTFLPEIKTDTLEPKEENSETKIADEKSEAEKSCNNSLSKKSLMASKMFQKFDFNELRLKNLRRNSTNEVQNKNTNEVRNKNVNEVLNKNTNEILNKNRIVNKNTNEVQNKQTNEVQNKNTNEVQMKNTIEIENKNEKIEIQVLDDTNTSNMDSLSNNKVMKNIAETSNLENFGKSFSPLSEDSKDVISDLDTFLNEYIEDIKTSADENLDSNLTDDDWLSSLLV